MTADTRAQVEQMTPTATTCQKCGQAGPTLFFLPEGISSLDDARSGGKHRLSWCEHCVLTAQIEFARRHADNLPKLEAKLQTLNARNAGFTPKESR